MCLLSVGLDTLGLLLRVWLWISVPMAVIILLVATWMNYLRNVRPKHGLNLAIEGLGGDMAAGGNLGGDMAAGGDTYIGRDDVVGEGDALLGARQDTGGKRGEEEEEEEEEEREELTATGKETIYNGILWIKEKYEQYREQSDRRYEQLREQLTRSERQYQELLAAVGEGELRKELGVKQGIIDSLEEQLRAERMKVEELVAKLQDLIKEASLLQSSMPPTQYSEGKPSDFAPASPATGD